MPHPSRTVAGVEVTPLCDAVGPMGPALARPLPQMFGGPDHPVWSHPEASDPAEPWILHFHCHLLRDRRDRLVLVDTGLGAVDSPAAAWAPVPGQLTGELAAVGVDPADVHAVVLTHLHSDHVSGSLLPDGATPAFPNARYLVQRAERDHLSGSPENPVWTGIIEPLRAAGRLELVDGDLRLGEDVTVLATPGHTPGHQSVRVGEGELVVSGDVLHHRVQLLDPTAGYCYDDDRERATATRLALLAALRARGGTLATAHLAEPFVTLRPDGAEPGPGSPPGTG